MLAFAVVLALLGARAAQAWTPGIKLDQCANGTAGSTTCTWQNGDLNAQNSAYREGDSVPFRVDITGLETSLASHTLVIEYDTLQGNPAKHAYDYETTYNRTVTGANPTEGTGVSGSPSTFPVPTGCIAGQPAGMTQVPGDFTIWNGTITNATCASSNGGTSEQITITFTTPNSEVVVAWGGHVASQIDWGPGQAAGSINGSPYHQRIISVDQTGGNQDRAMQSAVVVPAPTLNTDASAGSVQMGATVHDTATLSGWNGAVTGSVEFFLCGPSGSGAPNCLQSGGDLTRHSLGSATIDNNGTAVSAETSALVAVGTYCFDAVYTPDSTAQYSPAEATNQTIQNNGNHGECFTVQPATPALTTTPNPASATVGDTLKDTAHLSGGSSPTGTITFKLYAPSDATCSGTPADTETVTVSGTGDYTTPTGFATNGVGTWRWTAEYSGDANNQPAWSHCEAETVPVGQAAPTVATTPNPSSAAVGADLNDSALLAGGSNPTGSITFKLYGPADSTCTGTPLYTKTVSLTGLGAATTDGPTAATAGSYHWTADYSGDANNKAASSACAAEAVTVALVGPTITTTLSATEIVVGGSVSDSAALTGATSDAGGTVTYTVYTNSTCTAGAQNAGTKPVTNGTVADSDALTFATAGDFFWQAAYSGDANNAAATSVCTDEHLVVDRPAISITKNPKSQSIDSGATASFTIVVTNTGTVTLTDVAVTDAQAPGCAKTIGTLDPGGSSSYDCSLAGVTSSFTNSATATGHPPVGPNASASDTAAVSVNAAPAPSAPAPAAPAPAAGGTAPALATIDLAITKSGAPNPATVGGQVTWTLTVTNNGPSGATGVTVADPVPAGTTYVSATTTQGSCTGGAMLSCQIGSIANGASVTITLVTKANTAGTLTNIAKVVGNEQETNTANNTATASVKVNGPFVPPATKAAVCTALAVSPKQLFVGRQNVLTMRVSRNGKGVAGVRVRIKGSTVQLVTAPSNTKGVVRRTIKPLKAGIVSFVPVAQRSCKSPRIGVIGVFTPPVTG